MRLPDQHRKSHAPTASDGPRPGTGSQTGPQKLLLPWSAVKRSESGPLATLPLPVPTNAPDKSAVAIRGMFGRIAGRYDFLNRTLSLGSDVVWRRRASALLAPRPGEAILDLCSGTGDLALEVLRRSGGRTRVLAADFTFEMLALGRRKFRQAAAPIPEAGADGLRLPFGPGRFDAVVVSFGVRNFEDADRGFREIRRVLKPGGRLLVLEFTPRPTGPLAPAVSFWCERILPRVGRWVSGDSGAYRYLPDSVSAWPDPEELSVRLRAAGFADVRHERLFPGIAAIHLASSEVSP